MCRFTLYLGPSIRLSSLLTDPEHSLIRQSAHSREREEPLNGDGFGVGWYAREFSHEPAVFRSITPAWNNRNLHNLARVVASDCIFAHVRAATQSSGVNEPNCHPFRYERHLFMHNGDIGSFRSVRRHLLANVSDVAFSNVYGSTDSEHFFALLIDELIDAAARGAGGTPAGVGGMPTPAGGTRSRAGRTPSPAGRTPSRASRTPGHAGRTPSRASRTPGHAGRTPTHASPVERMAAAMERTIARVLEIVGAHGDGTPSHLNCAVSDGNHAVVSRFTDDRREAPPTLYYFRGRLYPDAHPPAPDHAEPPPVIVSSERLTADDGWQLIPPNHLIVLSRDAEPELRSIAHLGAARSAA